LHCMNDKVRGMTRGAVAVVIGITLSMAASAQDSGILRTPRRAVEGAIEMRNPAEIASHVRAFVRSSVHGFQPTEMLSMAETSLTGNLAHLDLVGIVQMLDQGRQSGVLHVNAGETDAVLFFEAGQIHHAEFGKLTGDQAVIQLIQACQRTGTGVYKFVAGTITNERTVHRRATDLLLDALREFDETNEHLAEREPS